MGRRIGIMGGTFSPIHYGHLFIANNALKELSLDEVIFIPNGNAYMKTGVLDAKHRIEMTKLAVSDYDAFSVSLIETNRQGNSYSYETISELHEAYPCDELFFIVGADSFLNMENWKCPDLIFKNCTVVVASRDGNDNQDVLKMKDIITGKYSCNIEILSIRNFDVSSSLIREYVKVGKDISKLVPDSVRMYIEENGLYRG